MCQGLTQQLDCAYQTLLPGQLLSGNLKLLLVQLKVCLPQLIHLVSNLNALMLPTCSQLCNSALSIHIVTRRSIARAITSLLAAMTGRIGISAFGPITRKP